MKKQYTYLGERSNSRETAVSIVGRYWVYRFITGAGNALTSGQVAEFKSPKFEPNIISDWITSRLVPDVSELITTKDWQQFS